MQAPSSSTQGAHDRLSVQVVKDMPVSLPECVCKNGVQELLANFEIQTCQWKRTHQGSQQKGWAVHAHTLSTHEGTKDSLTLEQQGSNVDEQGARTTMPHMVL